MKKISFPARPDFYKIIRHRIDQYFTETQLPKTGNWKMFLKSALILTWLVVSYFLLIFFSTSLIMAVLSAFAVAQGFVLVGL